MLRLFPQGDFGLFLQRRFYDNHESGFPQCIQMKITRPFGIESNQMPKYFMGKDWEMGDGRREMKKMKRKTSYK